MIRPAIPHGFDHAHDWSWAQIACGSCGFAERWEDLRDDSGKRPRGAHVRAAIRRDMHALLRTRGCVHV